MNSELILTNSREKNKDIQNRFLLAYTKCGIVSVAARASGIRNGSHRDWMENDPEYPRKFQLAEEESKDRLEKEARRRAVKGTRQYKFYRGQPILHPIKGTPYYEHAYSDTLLIRLLEASMPEKYRHRSENIVSTPSPPHDEIQLTDVLDDLPMSAKKSLLDALARAQERRLAQLPPQSPQPATSTAVIENRPDTPSDPENPV